MPQIEAYLRAAGARIAPYTLGVYGCYDVVEYLSARDVCRHYWQCVAWSGGKISANADLYQATGNVNVAGVLVDQNERYREAGLWKSTDAPSGASANENPPAAGEISGEEIYNRLQAYCLAQTLPAWAEAEYAEALARGLTDGENPMLFAPRYQAAILALRALRAAEGKEEKT